MRRPPQGLRQRPRLSSRSPYALLADDGLHPNAAGYALMAETWRKPLMRVLIADRGGDADEHPRPRRPAAGRRALLRLFPLLRPRRPERQQGLDGRAAALQPARLAPAPRRREDAPRRPRRQPADHRRGTRDRGAAPPHAGGQPARRARAPRRADRAAWRPPAQRHATRPTRAARQRRLDEKKGRGATKRQRSRPADAE